MWLLTQDLLDYNRMPGTGHVSVVFDFSHLPIIVFLPLVCQNGANDNAGVLDDHFTSFDVSLTEQPSSMNSRSEMEGGKKRILLKSVKKK